MNLNVISRRIKSLKNVGKVTKAMKMVSASRYTRAERDLEFVRPYGEAAVQFYLKADINAPENIPGKEKLYVAVASDRGLCGAVHANICNFIKGFITADPESKLVCIGEKSRYFLRSDFSKNIILVATGVGKKPITFRDVSKLTNSVLNSEYQPFHDGKILFNKARNIVSYSSTYVPIVSTGVLQQAPKLAFYDNIDNEVLQSYLEYSLVSLIYYAMKENNVAELSARMSAMEIASKNAEALIHDFSVSYNRSRQALVTRSITEIVSMLL